ncbi:efflux RND transporter permease subunit [Haliangium sp.]|uniref:efflux RND transporter permease subunit n=1 Tax=Haliangium sp. TaxID=2663208 RepID=UPI003D0A1F5B
MSAPEHTPVSPGKRWEEMLPRFSLDRRITVTMLMLTALAFGVVATIGIPLELIPQGFEAPHLNVIAPWRDAPPKEVLDKVVEPLEDELATVGGLEHMSSRSRTGQGRINLEFKSGTDMDVAYREVRDRVLRARANLPDDLEQIEIRKFNQSSLPILFIGVAMDPSVTDPYNLIQQELVVPLQRIDGVASVQSDGLQEKEILIELDREKTAAAGLNVYQVGAELARDNFSLASGDVRYGDKELLLRSMSRFANLDEIRDQLVNPTVRLGDIATVRYAVPEQYWRVRVNGKPALALQVIKEGPANTIEVSNRVKEVFKELQKNPKLQGSEVEILFDQGDTIIESLATLVDSGRIGGIFAVLVLLFFLRRFRLTLIITLAIPLSMVIALIAMYFAGETLNILSLLGLIISVGLLVDNSVVVAENIHRLHREGMPKRAACVRGAGEIALAVVLATLTTVVVFLPIALVEGRAQFFLLRLAIPISVSLAASLVVALVFIPLCVYLTLGKAGASRRRRLIAHTHQAMDRSLGGLYRITLAPLNRLYGRILAVALRRRFDIGLAVMAVIMATGAAMKLSSIEFVEVSQEDRKDFRIQVDLPSNYNLEDAESFFAEIEVMMEQTKKELALEGYLLVFAANWGRVEGWFPNQKDATRLEITDKVMARLPQRAGIKYFSGTEDEGVGKGDRSTYQVVLNGEDADSLATVATALEGQLSAVEGVIGIQRNDEASPNELALVVDRDRAQRQGISPTAIAGVVAAGLRGRPLPRYQDAGREIPMRVRFEEDDRESLAELADFSVPTVSGQYAKLSSVTDVRFLSSARTIRRHGKRVSHTVSVDLEEGAERETRARLDAVVSRFDLPEGIRIGPPVADRRLQAEIQSLTFALLVSVIFIYLIMAFLFESLVLPLSVLLTIPLASIGVFWGHIAVGRDIDFLGFVGILLLVGIVVNNGIVLIDYVNRLRQDGIARTEALLLAARRRFRPIMMTAGTTVCGMIPLTMGDPTSIGLSYKSFGLTLIGGMLTATALTLLVVPVFYTLFEDARDLCRQGLRWALGRG